MASTAFSLSLPTFPSSSSTVKAKPSIFSHHHLFIAKNVPSSSLFSSSTRITKQIRTAFKIKCSSASFSNTLPSALLFDCDGVLVDTEKDGHRVSFNDTFNEKELGVTWDVDLYGELLKIGGGKERLIDQALGEGVKVAVCSTSNEKAVSAVVSCLLGPERAEKIQIFAGDVVPRKKPDPVSMSSLILKFNRVTSS
ncbi:hypothetical protein Gogos_013947 [Gossypium gossypioides]|uniref:Uncharacterized protein n=1 Tax=Gossypium gossypioides TaxID=34282 RepID=A0A7J9BX90_GOSGO|nr:hypothetical protein [Gossypium gossypioides]